MRLHVVDGTFELFRAQYSKRPDRFSRDGQNVKGTIGVMASTLALISDPAEQATHIAVAFDNPIESFRNDMFDGYKTGAGMDPVLTSQMDLVEEAVAAIGAVVWSMDRFEADDALAAAAHRWKDDVDQVRIMTPDKDLGQCVCGDHVVQVDRIRGRVINEKGVMERNGVVPACIPDWLALVGDTADGIPGIPGFGAKTASALLNEYGSVEAIPRDPEQWQVKVRGAARLADTLNGMRAEVGLYKDLATLALDVPLQESLEDLRWQGVPREPYEEIQAALGSLNYPVPRWRE